MVKRVENDSVQNKGSYVSNEFKEAILKKVKDEKMKKIAAEVADAIKNGRVTVVEPGSETLIFGSAIGRLTNTPITYQQKVDKEQTTIENLIEPGKEPLKRPNEKPMQTLNGPNGGKLEVFPQRANGTYVTIETLDNGETFECTYSESGNKLNEIRRNSLSTTITTYNGNSTDKVTISKMNGVDIVGKIQVGNMLTEAPPTLKDITGMPLMGWRTK